MTVLCGQGWSPRQGWARQQGRDSSALAAEALSALAMAAIKNRPHVPGPRLSPPAPQAQTSQQWREKTDKFGSGQHREVDKMTLGKLHHWQQPGSDWRQQTLRRQENWKIALTRIRIDNEEDPSWQQLGAKAVRGMQWADCFSGTFQSCLATTKPRMAVSVATSPCSLAL